MAQLIHGTTINGHIAIHAGNMSDHSLATTSYVTTQINNLINGAPGALDTLNELAAALGNNASFSTSVTNSLAGKLSLTGGTMTGKILAVSTGTGTYDTAIELRETGYATTSQSAWGYSPAMTFHWGGRHAKRFGMRADGLFAIEDEPIALRSWVTSQSYLTSLPSHNHDDRYYTESESDGRYLYYRGYSTDGDTQDFQSTANTVRFDQVGALNNGAWSNQPTGYYTYGGILSLRGDSFGLQIYGSHTGDLAFKTQWDNDQHSGWRTIISSANIGSQSVSYATTAGSAPANGGNSDTVDGFHASVSASANTIPTRNSSGYLIPESWIQLNGTYGLYSPTNGAHLRPNSGSYGSWQMTGSRNGWQGIEFDSGSGGNISLMVAADSNTVGFHNNNYGWQFRWNGGTLYVYKNAYGAGTEATVLDSSNYSSWAQPIASAINTGNIGSQSVNYATTAGTANAVAWTNVSSRPTALSQFSNDLGNYGGFLTSLPSHTHDDRYYTESESDSRFINESGDSMSGSLTLGAGAAYVGTHGTWTGEQNKIQWHSNNLYLQNTGGGNFFFRRADGTNLFNLDNNGSLIISGDLYPNGQGTYRLYVANSGLWTNGNFGASGDLYLGTRSTWLSSWLNQSVQTGANPTFGEIYVNGKYSYFGASSGWDSGSLNGQNGTITNVHFQGHQDFWIGAGNTQWYTSAVGAHHDLLINTMQSGGSNVRGITFTASNGGASVYRLGRWHSGTSAITSYLNLENRLAVGVASYAYELPSATVYVKGSTDGADVLAVDGVNGRLFTITDSVLDTIYSVNTIAGLPILEVLANSTVNLGPFSAPIVINASGISTPSHGTSANWFTAFNKRPTGIGFSGSSTKTLTLTLGDGSTLTAAFNDIDTDTNTDGQTLSISGSTLTISGGNSITIPSGGISQATADGLYQPLENQRLSTGNAPTFADVYTNGWFRNNAVNTGLYNQSSGNHFYSRTAAKWGITGNGGNIHLEFRSNHESTLRGVVYADTSNQIGFLNNGEGWSLRANSSNNVFVHGTDLTINADNAGASNINMNDGDEGARIIHCNSNRIGFLTQAGSWGAYCDDSGNWAAANFSGSSSGTNTGDQTNISGNAATATYATSAGSAPNASNLNASYGVTAGAGNGLKFWGGEDTYKISMGNSDEYHYGPVTDYSIKTVIDSVGSTRGFTWGVNGVTPIAALNVGNGNMRIAGTFTASNFSGTSSGTNTGDQTDISGNSNTTSQRVFSDLKINFPSGSGGGYSFGSNHYSMGLDSGNGAWSDPHYRDLIIGYHTGIRIGANYSGVRFYSNSPTTDANNDGNGDGGEALLMTVGGYVGTANHTDVVVNNNLIALSSLRAPIFYDSNNTAHYVDPSGGSNIRNLYVGDTGSSWSDPGGWGTQITFSNGPHTKLVLQARTPGISAGMYVHTPGSVYIGSYSAHDVVLMRAEGVRMTIYSSYTYAAGYLQAADSLRAPLFYDSEDTAYYLDPNSTSELYKFSGGTLDRNDGNSLHVNSPYLTRAAQNFRHRNGAMGWGNYDLNIIASNWGSGFFDTWGSPANGPASSGSGHYVGVQAFHYNDSNSANFHGWQMVCAQEAANRWFLRSSWNTPRAWVEMIHSGNIGSQTVSRADGALKLWAESHPTDYYVRANWTGSYWQLTSNHPSPVQVGYADNAGSASSASSAARATRANGNFYIDDNYGNTVVGVYSASRLQGVFAMGDAYKLAADGSSASNHYGIAWSHPNHGGTAARLTNHGMLVQGAGTTWTAISDSIWCIGDITAFSDARVKANVEVIDNPLERLSKVRGVTFTRIDLADPTKRYAGVIAQEMREALPEVVTEDGNGELSVSYGNTVSLLIESIKAQQVQIEELKLEVKKLKGA